MILEVIDRIYDAALDRRRWWLALARLGEVLRCGKVALLREMDGKWQVLAASDAAAEAESEDRTLAAAPIGCAAIPLSPRDGLALLIDREGLGEIEGEILRQVAGHLARAWRITERLAEAEARERFGSSDFDRLPFGVILLTPDRVVAQINREARRLLRLQRDLRLADGKLVGTNAAIEEALFAACREVAAVSTESRGGPSQELGLRASAGGVDIVLQLVPTPGAGGAPGEPEIVGFVRDGERFDLAPQAILARRFHLDSIDERLLVEILRGQPVVHRWRELRLSQREVQDRLRRLYERLGSTRQRDLVRLLLSLPEEELTTPWEGVPPLSE